MNITLQNIFSDFITSYISPGFIVGFWIEFFIVALIISMFRLFPKSNFVVLCDYAFESVYSFFEDLLGEDEKDWIKMFVTALFFIIIFSNLLGVLFEFISPIFGESFHHYIQIPTANINFNIAMAIVGIVIVLYEQFSHLGFGKFIYEYFPIFGKGYVPYEKGSHKPIIDIPLGILVKIFDIIISLFLGVLEIIGLLAKIISLSFRLFGNITSGGILLTMLMGAVGAMSVSLIHFEFPVLIPLIVYAQEILVACIQAFVFPLLIAIFIRVAKIH